MGQKVIIMFWWEFRLSFAFKNHLTTFYKPSIHFLQTLHRMFVFRDSSLYPKQLSLFCLPRLVSASADRIGYISNFCSMIELLHEFKNSFF